jgi:hypothetical protein
MGRAEGKEERIEERQKSVKSMTLCNPKDTPKQKRPSEDDRKRLILLMGLPRLERGTYCLGGSRSIHLSYKP